MVTRGWGLFSLYIYIENLKNLLVRNHSTNFSIILQKCFFGDPLPRLFKPFGFVKKHGCPASKTYRTHIGPKWVFIWVLHGQPIRDSWGICNRVPCWAHMGKAMWELYGSSMGKINPLLSSRKTIFTQMIISPQSQPIWRTGKVPTDRDLCTCASYCLKDIGVFFNSWKCWHHAYLYIPLNFKNNGDIRVKIKIWPWIDVHVGKIVKINLIDTFIL